MTGITAGIVAVGPGTAVGEGTGVITGEGVGHGDGVTPWVGDGSGVGDGDTVGTGAVVGAGVTVGLGVTAISVGTGRGVVIGSKDGQPDGSKARLRVVRWLTQVPRSTSAMGRTYAIMPIKQIKARKFNRALSIRHPQQDGPGPGQLLL